MPRPRLPLAKAKMLGADVRSRGRFADRSEPTSAPLGKPSPSCTPEEVQAWKSLKREFPWLAESDRALVEIAARMRARFWRDPDMGVQALNLYRMCLSSMGGSPADRTKVSAPKDDDGDKDPAAGYFN